MRNECKTRAPQDMIMMSLGGVFGRLIPLKFAGTARHGSAELSRVESHASVIVGAEVTRTLETARLLRPPPHRHRLGPSEITGS